MKIILINGPKRSGKDSGASYLGRELGTWRYGFADELKRRTHALYDIAHLPFDHFEHRKDEPCAEFHGLSPRQAYIEVSERHMKRLHGQRIFGTLWCARVETEVARAERRGVTLPPAIVVPDSGFHPEADEVADTYGIENLTLIRLHRPGHDFTGDSRGYIDLPGVRTLDLFNDVQGDPLPYHQRLAEVVRDAIR